MLAPIAGIRTSSQQSALQRAYQLKAGQFQPRRKVQVNLGGKQIKA